MRRSLAIAFLSIYLFSNTYVSQLLKIPMLFEHYNEHKQQNSNISFIDFLKMHYAQGNVIDSDYDKDMKLPFKTGDCNNGLSVYNISEPLSFCIQEPTYYLVSQQRFSNNNSDFSSAYLSAIWQPPRSC